MTTSTNSRNTWKRIWSKRAVVLFGLVVVYWVYAVILKGEVRRYLLKTNPQETTAVVIDEKNYYGNLKGSGKFSYSYEFTVNGEQYRNDSRDRSLRVGDTVIVQFVEDYPNLNRLKMTE